MIDDYLLGIREFFCDMPFINSGLITYMRKNSAGYDVVVPRNNKRYEPLFCIYSKSCIRFIKPLLDKKIFKVSGFFRRVKVRKITPQEILRFAVPKKFFTNINTPDDLLIAGRPASRQKAGRVNG